eukprot:IDg21693t1
MGHLSMWVDIIGSTLYEIKIGTEGVWTHRTTEGRNKTINALTMLQNEFSSCRDSSSKCGQGGAGTGTISYLQFFCIASIPTHLPTVDSSFSQAAIGRGNAISRRASTSSLY